MPSQSNPLPPAHLRVVCIGAGPAGLTAGLQLARRGAAVTVLEADPVYVGGISKTVRYKDYRFDIGGHRFFSKSRAVEDFWTELLGDDLLPRPRSSKIYYKGRFFSYPLRAGEALRKLGPVESLLCVLSYLRARLTPVRDPRNFEEWVSNRFGRRLYRIFFKTYTEKVWGMDCRAISADWAAQRIRGLSLASAAYHALFPQRNADQGRVINTLIDSFRYPRKGPGMMWERAAERIGEAGGRVLLGCKVTGLRRNADTGVWTVAFNGPAGAESIACDHVISSAPLRSLMRILEPAVSAEAREAAARLRYRDFIVVALMTGGRDAFPDNWIYIHDPAVKVGRVQNFRSWSPEMVSRPDANCYGLEYFCFEDDGLWNASDADLIKLATDEIHALGLIDRSEIVDGCVVRQKKAYPIYDETYAANVEAVRRGLVAYPGLHVVGRNGMHTYNNQDHSIMTAMLTAENILAGRPVYDVWRVNKDAIYHEQGDRDDGGRSVPRRTAPKS